MGRSPPPPGLAHPDLFPFFPTPHLSSSLCRPRGHGAAAPTRLRVAAVASSEEIRTGPCPRGEGDIPPTPTSLSLPCLTSNPGRPSHHGRTSRACIATVHSSPPLCVRSMRHPRL